MVHGHETFTRKVSLTSSECVGSKLVITLGSGLSSRDSKHGQGHGIVVLVKTLNLLITLLELAGGKG